MKGNHKKTDVAIHQNWLVVPIYCVILLSLSSSTFTWNVATAQENSEYPFQFKCEDGSCIPERLRCNEIQDCVNGTDELNCFPGTGPCTGDKHICTSSGKCIPTEFKCDGENDCEDGSDEVKCPCNETDQFTCQNGQCIGMGFECDGTEDCLDGSDELKCVRCGINAFKCGNNRCIPNIKLCDKTDDCGDKNRGMDSSDEKDCTELVCSADQFYCRMGACIPKRSRCNKKFDCNDWSDELNCTEGNYCASTQFTCTSGGCTSRKAVCDSKLDCLDKSDETDCQDGAPTSWIGRSWDHASSDPQLILQHADKNIIVYYNGTDQISIKWLFSALSKSWGYLRQIFNSSADDPRLYVILRLIDSTETTDPPHKPSYICTTSYHTNYKYDRRNVLECEFPIEFTDNSLKNLENVLTPLSDLIIAELTPYVLSSLRSNRNVFQPGIDLIKYVKHIIFYDLYLRVGGRRDEIANWRVDKHLEDSENIQKIEELIFHVYKQYGGIATLGNFFVLIKLYQPGGLDRRGFKHTQRYSPRAIPSLEFGILVYFMSAACGTDLELMAFKAFNISQAIEDWYIYGHELTWEKRRYPFLTYLNSELSRSLKEYVPPRSWRKTWDGQRDQHLTLVYSGQNIAFYFKNFQTHATTSFGNVSKIWDLVIDRYGPFGNDSFLHIVLDRKRGISTEKESCISSNAKTYIDPEFDYRHVIECGPTAYTSWIHPTRPGYLDDILVQMARMILKISSGTGNWPPHQVTGWTMESILVYDIYSALGPSWKPHEDKWLRRQNTQMKRFGSHEKFWFRDWYKHIYDRYEGDKVLKKFLHLLHAKWPKTRDGLNYEDQLNVGEFVHFWCGACESNYLIRYAATFFDGDSIYREDLRNARIKITGLNYTCAECDKDDTEKSDWTLYIVLGGCGGLLTIFLLAVGVKFAMYKLRIWKLTEYIRDLTSTEVDEFYQGNPHVNSSEAHAALEALPHNESYEVPKERLIVDEKCTLGSGEYGIVKKGILKGDPTSGTLDRVVAIKMSKKKVEVAFFKAMLAEIKIMSYVGAHSNIAALLATITTNIGNCEVYMAIEFCANGDLRQYLSSNSDSFVDLFQFAQSADSSSVYSNFNFSKTAAETPVVSLPAKKKKGSRITYKAPVSINTFDVLEWSSQIASGMDYLNVKNIIHGDLAARNVLLTENNIAKISDFGLSRQLVNYSNYLKKSKVPLPFRWLAIESLTSQNFSMQSDIWAYGVTLWEIFTLGKVPYAGRTWDHDFVDELVLGMRLASPKFGNDELYFLMLDCMKKVPNDRISFSQIVWKLDEIKSHLNGIGGHSDFSSSSATGPTININPSSSLPALPPRKR